MIFDSPLSVPVGKSKFILNLNNYRNTHFRKLNTAKINYKLIMASQIRRAEGFEKIKIHYTLYPKTKRRTDIANVVSVHAKFFCDALVEYGVLVDDNFEYLVASSESFGRVDKNNPRVEIIVSEIS